ncbi:hypothetical protein TcasGA2_TC004175 [Tribolium castaneum]|uniref:Uncharacterized protein n=1 Tax=Tribolium castaneum TaxID=7070 RepID=D7EJC3_TRICA|nr:hypothetical protein TcasGA2_TC004175 [Tribolium castaneum]
MFALNRKNSTFNFKKADFPKLYDLLSKVDWSEMTNVKEVNAACDFFYNTLECIFEACVPKTSISKISRRSYPVWFDSTIINCLKHKARVLKKFRMYQCQRHLDEFKKLRSQAKFLIAKGYSEYVKSMEDTISHDPRKFWTFIQTKRGKSRIPGTIFVNGEAISDPCIIVNNFADYFKSVYTVSLDNNYSANMTTNNNILLPKISEDDILRQLREL